MIHTNCAGEAADAATPEADADRLTVSSDRHGGEAADAATADADRLAVSSERHRLQGSRPLLLQRFIHSIHLAHTAVSTSGRSKPVQDEVCFMYGLYAVLCVGLSMCYVVTQFVLSAPCSLCYVRACSLQCNVL